MKVFVYESENSLNSFFRSPEFAIPFLSTNLLSFMGAGVVRNSILLDEDYQIFLPSSWERHIENASSFYFYDGDVKNKLEKHQKREYEVVVLTNLFSLLLLDFFDEDISHLKQNPEKLFSNRGVLGGYLKRGQELGKPEDYDGFKNILELTDSNFLKLNQDLVANLDIESVGVGARSYGRPIILSKDVSEDSTICGPCFIGEEVSIENSYIAPGTVITGVSRIEESRIYSSFLNEVSIFSSRVEDSMVTETRMLNGEISKSLLPSGSVIVGERKV